MSQVIYVWVVSAENNTYVDDADKLCHMWTGQAHSMRALPAPADSHRHTATRWNTLRHNATHCICSLQHHVMSGQNQTTFSTDSHVICDIICVACANRLRPHCTTLHLTASHCTTLYHIAPNCTTLHHSGACSKFRLLIQCDIILQHTCTAPHCNTLQHTAANCHTLPHIATLPKNCSSRFRPLFSTWSSTASRLFTILKSQIYSHCDWYV